MVPDSTHRSPQTHHVHRGKSFLVIHGNTLLFGLCAFYSVLTALYYAAGVYSPSALPNKNSLLGAPFDPALLVRMGLATGVSLFAAIGLTAFRTSTRSLPQCISFVGALASFITVVAGCQQHYLADRLSFSAALLALLPSGALLAWTTVAAERNAQLFSRFNSLLDQGVHGWLGRRLLGRSWILWLTLGAGILVTAYFIAFALNQYWLLEPRYDTARFENTYWHTLHGRIAWESPDWINYLGNHFTPTLGLLLPVYALFPHGTTLLVMESILLTSGAIPLWWLTYRVTKSERSAYVFAIGYLCFPQVIGVNIQGFTEGCLVPVVGFTYLLCLEQPQFYRRVWFWIALVLMIGIKEEVAVTVSAISLAHWIQNRDRAGHAMVVGVCAVWFLVVTKLVMPALLGPAGHPLYGKGWLYAFYFEDMLPDAARSFTGYIVNAALNPLQTLMMIARPHTLKFLMDISLPLMFLPWFGGLYLLGTLPSLLLVNLLTTYHRPSSTLSIYIIYAVPWFYAAIYGWKRLRERFPNAVFIGQNGLLYTMILVSIVVFSQNYRGTRTVNQEQAELGAWLEAQPPDLRIMATHCFVPFLAHRDIVRTLNPEEDLSHIDLVIAQRENKYCAYYKEKEDFGKIRQAVVATREFEEAPSPQSGIVVYRRIRPPSVKGATAG